MVFFRRAPVYTFAEDICFGGAHVILSSGNKVYANDFSLIGDFGFSLGSLNYFELLKQQKIEYSGIHSDNANKPKMNYAEKISKEDIEWAQKALKGNEQELREIILKNRKERFLEAKTSKEVLEQELFSQAFIPAKKAKELG